MSLWEKYHQTVRSNFPEIGEASFSIGYWRDYLFFITIIYSGPFCLIAVIPGLIASAVAGYHEIIFFDMVLVVVLYLIAFDRHLSIQNKKLLFVFLVYAFAIILFKNLGSYGPGLVYLLAVSIFAIIIFPDRYSFFTLGANTVLCIIYGLIIYMDVKELHTSDQYQVLSWFAVSSNLLFLNLLFAFLIPKMFQGMHQTLESQIQLRKELAQEQQKLKQSLDQLKRKNNELEQFAYFASHDLQEPLRMITGFLSRLDAKYSPQLDEKGKTYIALAVDGAARMRQIISDILQYARAGSEEPGTQTVDLNEILQTSLQNLQRPIQEKKALIESDPLPSIQGTESQLEQVFQNLLENAIKYCPEDRQPRIHVSSVDLGSHYQISVRDNGIGIEKEYFQKIFTIFQRLHDRTSYEGTGIGLAIVKKIVESLHGKIWVESEPGTGSTFLFTIKKNM